MAKAPAKVKLVTRTMRAKALGQDHNGTLHRPGEEFVLTYNENKPPSWAEPAGEVQPADPLAK